MRNFSLDNTVGCLVDSFQISTSPSAAKQINHHHQDHHHHQASQSKLCGERKLTTGKLKFS